MFGFYGPNDYNNSSEFSCMFGVELMIKNLSCICIRLTNHDQLLGGYWFLHTLFFASFISYGLIKYMKKSCLSLLFTILISIFMYYFEITLPFLYVGGLEFLASSFIILGYICSKSSYYKFCLSKIPFLFLLFVLISYCAIKYWACSMLTITWDKVLLYICSAFISIITIHSLCSVICIHQRRLTLILSYVGNNTMSILTWHFLIFKIVSIILIFVYDLPYDMVSSFPVIEMNNSTLWILYFISGAFVPVLFSKYFNIRSV